MNVSAARAIQGDALLMHRAMIVNKHRARALKQRQRFFRNVGETERAFRARIDTARKPDQDGRKARIESNESANGIRFHNLKSLREIEKS